MRSLTYALKNIRRAPYQAIAAILVLTITFFVAQMFALLLLSSEAILNYFETQPQVIAFFEDTATPEELNQLKLQLEAFEYVDEVQYVSKQDAMEIHRAQNADDPLLFEMVPANSLPASLEVSATSAEYLPEIQKVLVTAANVGEVIYQEDVVDTLMGWTQGLRAGGVFLIVVLGITSLLVMTVIISMKVSSKKAEISTLRLLGAKPWFVRGPFVIEGALYGLLGALTAWVLLYTGLLYSTPVLLNFFKSIPVLPIPFQTMLYILGGSAVIGMLIGMISGSFSSSRYTR